MKSKIEIMKIMKNEIIEIMKKVNENNEMKK